MTARKLQRLAVDHAVLVAGIAICVMFAILSDRFLTVANLENVAVQTAVVAIVAVGMTYVILTAGIDLSVGAIVFLAAAVGAHLLQSDLSPVLVGLGIVAAATAMGALNGVAVGGFGINPLIVTLATLSLFRGIAGRITDLQRIPIPDSLRGPGTADLLGIPAPVFITLAVVAVGHLVYKRTLFGRYVQAIGTNPEAAREMGLPIRRVTVGAYALIGLFTGLATLVSIGQLGSVEPSTGSGLELTVITAVVLGGTSLSGGRGSVLGALLGALILTIVGNGLVLVGASPYIFDIVRATVLIVAVGADAIQRRALKIRALSVGWGTTQAGGAESPAR
jgi:ribose transport system permease protein